MEVLYYTGRLLQSGSVQLDPGNLEFIQQYYLLENLAQGLVRDDNRAQSGYVPGIASGWLRVDERTWRFSIPDDRKWSDGTAIDATYIVEEICRLRDSKSRHVRILRLMEDCRWDAGERTLVMAFKAPVDAWILHELSLADVAIVHPSSRYGDWSVTSGAYRIERVDAGKLEIVLGRNPYFDGAVEGAPARVRIFWPKDPQELERAFTSMKVDVFPTVANVFSRRQALMAKAAAEQFWGFPNNVQMFRFNWQHPLARDADCRRGLASLVHQAFAGWKVGELVVRDAQLIPVGHEGRLEDVAAPSVDVRACLVGKQVVLRVEPQLRDLPEFGERLEAAAKRHGLDLTFLYEKAARVEGAPDELASLYAFKGNQKDALGNWSFLMSQNGPLAPFEARFAPLLEQVATAQDGGERQRLLSDLHKQVLSEALVVPVYFENAAIFSSGKFDLSALDRFDLRPRFFKMAER